jgi:hypothetical protein
LCRESRPAATRARETASLIETSKTFLLQQSFALGRLPRRLDSQAEFNGAGGSHTHISINRISSLDDAMHPKSGRQHKEIAP